jgi:hypothetical protein
MVSNAGPVSGQNGGKPRRRAAAPRPSRVPRSFAAEASVDPTGAHGRDAPEALVVVTLRAADGSVVKIEAVEPDGSRHELSASDTPRLLGERPKPTLEHLVQEAFEAGIACVLDEAAEASVDEASGESAEEVDLHDALLGSLIEHSPARHLLRREVLGSAMLGTIIREAAEDRPAAG